MSSKSTDVTLLQLGGRTCEACAYSVKTVYQKSFWATPFEWREFPKQAEKKEAIIDFLRHPPDCPFIICVCADKKVKNMIHRAVINYNKSFIGVTFCASGIHSVWLSKETIAALTDVNAPVSLNQRTPTSHLVNYLKKKGDAS